MYLPTVLARWALSWSVTTFSCFLLLIADGVLADPRRERHQGEEFNQPLDEGAHNMRHKPPQKLPEGGLPYAAIFLLYPAQGAGDLYLPRRDLRQRSIA